MTEGDVVEILKQRFNVSRETIMQLKHLVDLVTEENRQQNLISAATIPNIWQRHILDSAQLLSFVHPAGAWLDLGTGGGFPGLVVALTRDQPIIMVEERRKRIEFLTSAISALNLPHAQIHGGRLELMKTTHVNTISARAFAPLPKLFELAWRFSTPETIWVLPKGQRAQEELEAARETWQGEFRVEPSMTDPNAGIIVARNVQPRKRA